MNPNPRDPHANGADHWEGQMPFREGRTHPRRDVFGIRSGDDRSYSFDGGDGVRVAPGTTIRSDRHDRPSFHIDRLFGLWASAGRPSFRCVISASGS
jgi:hypothetical protein